jgi:lipoic acid synthetase
VKKGHPLPIDDKEPQHLAEAADKLNLNYVVITSTTRDDLPDGGASHFIKTIHMLHERRPGAYVEVLIPDFLGSSEAIRALVKSQPEVINHNLETVPRLYPQVRPEADYSRSLSLLSSVKKLNPKIVTKSGLMLGLGEETDEILEVMKDLRKANCDLLTLGQYLQPSPQHLPVARYISPEEFRELGVTARKMGFADAASMPLVRSSFRAAELYRKARTAKTAG